MTSKEKQKELRKIEQTYTWVDLLANMDECEYGRNGYQEQQLNENLLRFYKNVDYRILFWSLSTYEKEVRNTKVENKNEKL
jgi:hypothetical protein